MFVEPIGPRKAPATAAVSDSAATADHAPMVPIRVVVGSATILWACYFLLVTLRSLVVESAGFFEMLLPRLVVAFAGVVMTLAAWLVLRRFDAKRMWKRVTVALVIMLPAALMLAFINHRAFASIDAHLEAQENSLRALKVRQDTAGNLMVEVPDSPILTPAQMKAVRARMKELRFWQEISDITLGRYFLLLAWAALYLALVNGQELQAAERREGDLRRAAKAAELRSLRYQINPHFLFNTLNSLSALVMIGKIDSAETMIQTLSNFYRRTLVGDPTDDLPLADEIALQKLYLEIEAVRFPERLKLEIALPEPLRDVLVPGMLLQPLIENSVKYAVAPSRNPVTIRIDVAVEGAELVLTVSDDGSGTGALGHTVGCGIGLNNVRDRLAARFGGEAQLETGPRAAGGYETVIRMPAVRHG